MQGGSAKTFLKSRMLYMGGVGCLGGCGMNGAIDVP